MEYKVLHLFSGIGGGALGFQQAVCEYKGLVGTFRTLAGIDCDPLACEDFERLTGAPAIQMDLFTRDDYIDFHGKEPPENWQEVTPWDLYQAVGDYPDMVFMSPPCKGYSGLLPSASASSAKYQALNRLVPRSANLTCEAFEEYLPSALLVENVPRITSRGSALLRQVKDALKKHGYVFDEATHDCGEIGGLGQRRKRYLLIARNQRKMPAFIYKPPQQRVKSIGEVIGPIPLPDDPSMGPLHRMPRLQWKTWVRLALIPAGGDWRDLQNINPEQYRIVYEPRNCSFGMMDWEQPSGTVTGNMRPGGSSAACIPDPRLNLADGTHQAIYKVCRWNSESGTVTGAHRPNNGAICIPDPRLQSCEGKHPGVYRIVKFDEPGPCVTGTRFGSGAPAIADPRPTCKSRPNLYGVANWVNPIGAVTGSVCVTGSNAVGAVADPRFNGPAKYNHSFTVTAWNDASGVVASGTGPSNGGHVVADPRLGCNPRSGTLGVQKWDEPSKVVTGSADIHCVASAIADPRIPADNENGVWIIVAEDGTWHRPLTTLELAALQGFPLRMPDGSPLVLAGKSDSRWREAIGNAVPPPAARAIAEQILPSLMASSLGEWFMSSMSVWVDSNQRPIPVRLMQ